MTTSDHSFLAIARCFSRTKLDFGSKFLLCTQFGLFSVLYFALRIASVRILGAGRMLESKAVIMIDAKMIETQMVADARCAKTCWGLQPGPAPGPGLIGYHLCCLSRHRVENFKMQLRLAPRCLWYLVQLLFTFVQHPF